MASLRSPITYDDDLYSGYNEYPTALSTKDLENDEIVQEALKSRYGKRPIATSKPGTAMRLGTSSGYREGTSMNFRPVTGDLDGINRPMTAVRGAGYTSQRQGQMFDPLNQASSSPSPQLEMKKEETQEEKVKKMERSILTLIEESCLANNRGELSLALQKAREASNRERHIMHLQGETGLSEGHNLDITYAVLFNLAIHFAANDMYPEALNSYNLITKNRMFHSANRLKVNMGNIYFKLGQYSKAIKMYHMALDQVPNTYKELRIKIMHNIGILFVKMGQFTDACSSFEFIMQEKPDFKTGLHVILCHYALGEKDKMKRSFQMLLEVPLNIDEERYNVLKDDVNSALILEAIKNDSLRKIELQLKQEAEQSILTAAKLIAPVIEENFSAGYNWCVDTIKASNYATLACDLEINKAVMFLKQKETAHAIETLKAFEKKDTKVLSTAATNLSFIYFLHGDIEQAEKYGEKARDADSYNSAAFVNLGNCSLAKGDVEKAKELYFCALENDSSCVEALYNLGLANKQLGQYDEALECYFKLQAIVKHHPQVLYQLANLHELVGDVDQATEWYLQLIGIVPTDPGILQKMGELYDSEGDKQQAFQYHFDSYRHFPANFEVIDWLGSYSIEMQVAEKAISYFERASLMQPDEVKWQLMVASCYRRSGNYHQALGIYKDIHRKFPENIECLKFLVRLCSDLGLKEATEYAMELKKAETSKEVRERIGSSRPGSRRSNSGLSSRGGSAVGSFSPLGDRGSPIQQGSQRSSLHSSVANRLNKLAIAENEGVYIPNQKEVDASYSDPLGPPAERPRTSIGRKASQDDDFADEELGDDLLPE